jgi:hypothetical protein
LVSACRGFLVRDRGWLRGWRRIELLLETSCTSVGGHSLGQDVGLVLDLASQGVDGSLLGRKIADLLGESVEQSDCRVDDSALLSNLRCSDRMLDWIVLRRVLILASIFPKCSCTSSNIQSSCPLTE